MKKNNYFNTWAIVTGASKGLGFCYAEELLKNGFNLVGVARDTSSLNSLEQKYPDSKIKKINLDLSDIDNCKKLFDETKDLDVSILINNAGFGVWGFFDQTDLEKELNMIDLNIKALHALTKLYVNKFKENNFGRVINIGSLLASYVSAPVFSSYYASKAYVYSLGVAINTELKKTKSKVRVTTICPGLLKTEFWDRSSDQKNADLKTPGRIMKTTTFAKKSLKKALKTNKDSVVIGINNKIAKWFSTHIPKKWVLSSIYNYQKSRK